MAMMIPMMVVMLMFSEKFGEDADDGCDDDHDDGVALAILSLLLVVVLLLQLFPLPVRALLEEDASTLLLPSEMQAVNDPEGIQPEPGLLQESIKSLTSKATPFDTLLPHGPNRGHRQV